MRTYVCYLEIIVGYVVLSCTVETKLETKLEGTSALCKRLVFVLGHSLYILRFLFQVRISFYYNYSKT